MMTEQLDPFAITLYCGAHLRHSFDDGDQGPDSALCAHVLSAVLRVFAQAGYAQTGVLETILLRQPLCDRTLDMTEAAVSRAGKGVVARAIREAITELDGGRAK